ncbi:MAG: sensor histidine kinase KdpD [Spirochaetes bacterium]|nr:MAG: sensor histidine kinase KdpD [Spirochaetota bacterium]
MTVHEDSRPDPESLLRVMRKNGGGTHRAALKVYFGMAAGVGKTHAMLSAAHRELALGNDVVAGYIETHGRADIERLAAGVVSVPRRKTIYRGVTIEEMDLDALLARRPGIALVDELAHTNAPDSRHPKRYQDVLELLDAGITVYTTLNVQHLESRAGTVGEITGVTVTETLPDSVLERADEVVLIDISPEALIARLAEGKVYAGERAKLAAENFFETGNLNALREMALRFTADKVDQSLQDYRQAKKIADPWKTGERLLVAVSASPYSESLIRWTRRTAYSLGASWIAVNVETSVPLSRRDGERLQKNIALARELGAEIVVTRDEDITGGILRIARQRNITQIVAGKPGKPSWRDVFRMRTPIKRLIRESGGIDLYIIRAQEERDFSRGREPVPARGEINWRHYAIAGGVLAGVVSLNYLALPLIGARSVALILLLSVLVLALVLDRVPVFIYAALSALLWNFLFLPPVFTFYITEIDDAIMFFMYFIIAVIVGSLTSRIRTQEKAAVQREEHLNVLYTITRKFASSPTVDEAALHILSYINMKFNAETVLYVKNEDGALSDTPHPASSPAPDEKEHGVALFSFTNGRTAGRFTDTLPLSAYMFIPLFLDREHVAGVMGIRFPEDTLVSIEQRTLLETLAGHLAMALEREFFTRESQRAQIHEESEKLYRVLMNSLTHEIRTPLTAIKGSISTMTDPAVGANPEMRARLLEETGEAAERLIRLVDSLLDMSRIESGKLALNADWNDVQDIIGVAIGRLEPQLGGRDLAVDCPDDLPLVRVDLALVALALYSLAHNAVVHTPPGTAIGISAARLERGVAVTVEDRGAGLAPADTGRLFEKFYRGGTGTAHGGLGLGLSICRGIVELHGGTVSAGNGDAGGARFVITLPVETREKGEQPVHEG